MTWRNLAILLVWVDGSYGLIKWKMEMQLKRSSHVDFGNPDFVRYAESFGAKGYLSGRRPTVADP